MRAAENLDLNWRGLRNYADANSDFADDWADARAKSVEGIEKLLWDAAEDREPWAMNKILDAYVPEVFNRPKEIKMDVSGKVEHTLTGKNADNVIAEMREKAQKRLDAAADDKEEYIEAEIVDDDTPIGPDWSDIPDTPEAPEPEHAITPEWQRVADCFNRLPELPPAPIEEPTETTGPPMPWATKESEDNDNIDES